MNKQLLILFLCLLFPYFVISQSHDSITIKGDNDVAFKRCYLCCGIYPPDSVLIKSPYFKRPGDSIYNWLITAYLKGDSIQKITELIEVGGKDYGGGVLITYKFYHDKLIEADDDNPGAVYNYSFRNDSLVGRRVAVDDLGFFRLSPNNALIYSREDENMVLSSKAYINRRHH